MAIGYPLNLPSSAALIDSIRFSELNAVSMLRSPWTFSTQVQQHQGQLWTVEVAIVPCQRPLAEPWLGFLSSLMGNVGTFRLGDPNGRAPRGAATGSPKVNGANQTGNTLNTKDWTNSVTGILRAGDYMQIGSRLHKVLQDANSNGSGQATLEIWPRLRETPADNATIITNNATGLFRLTDPNIDLIEIDREKVYNVSFSASEAI